MNYKEYCELKETINIHMDAYYNNDAPLISDYEYDILMQNLKNCEREHPDWITPDSPSQKIGGVAKRTAGVKVIHNVPMLSIEDVFNKDDVVSWVKKVLLIHPNCSFSVETKIDGLSMNLRYIRKSDGKLHLVLAETRGDGIEGEDVTENAIMMNDALKIINLPYEFLEIRGEVYISHDDFDIYNLTQEKNGNALAANPRNLAAGTLRQLDPKIVKERNLRMKIFNIQDGPNELMASHTLGLTILKNAGVPVVYFKKCTEINDILNTIDFIGDHRESFSFDIDGAVIKLDDISYRNDFPAGSKYSSGHIAYKYPPEERLVVMDDVFVDVGRTGKLTFTGKFHDKETGLPVHLCGTNVSRATLHNIDYINDMKIGIGGMYKVYKSGEIIPKLNGCVKNPIEIFKAPTRCPICNSKLIKGLDTPDIYCVNPACPSQLTRTISYFVSSDCMNIAGLGEILIDSLIKEGYVTCFADLYSLSDKREELIFKGILGKENNTDKILENIEKSKSNDCVKLLTGLGIRNVGKRTARSLMEHFHSIEELANSNVSDLTIIEDVGEVTANYICDFFSLPENRYVIEQMKKHGVNMNSSINNGSGKLNGIIFVITGTLQTMDRNEAISLILNNGGKCSDNVSKNTTYVLAGENAGSKLSKAIELNIPIIDENEFLNIIKY